MVSPTPPRERLPGPQSAGVPVVDDATHSVLSRGHPVAQTELGHFGAEAARLGRMLEPRLGYQVQETEARQALAHCVLPEVVWSLNPYTGCSHDCVYCYVPEVAHVDRERYGSYVIVKRNLPSLLGRELKRKEVRPIFLSSATDPYQPAEGVYEITRRCLEVLSRHKAAVRVLTRSPLVLRDLDLLHTFDDLAIGLSIPTLDDAARKAIEPSAPAIASRLSTVRRLADEGFEPFVNVMPAYPFTPESGPRALAQALKEAGAHVVHAGPWRYLGGVMPALMERVASSPWSSFVPTVQDEAYADRQMRALRAACEREGLPFRGGRRYRRTDAPTPPTAAAV